MYRELYITLLIIALSPLNTVVNTDYLVNEQLIYT